MALNTRLKEYDPKEVIITWSGVPLNDGIVDGTFVVVKRNVPLWRLVKGGDGEGARIRTKNHSGTIQVTTRGGSEIHQLLAAIANADALSGVIVAPLLVLDFSGRTLHAANRAFIQDFPEDTFSTQEEPRTWIWECDALFMFPGGSRDVSITTDRIVGFPGLPTQ